MERALSACQVALVMLKTILASAFRQRSWPAWALTYLYVFRVIVVGSCLGVLAIAWFAHIQWLVMASACIAIGECVESSYYIIVLRWAERSGHLTI
jgi:hypothetical protein